jgi:hypothetical protein
MKAQKNDLKTKIALTIAALSYSNCLYLINQPDLKPPSSKSRSSSSKKAPDQPSENKPAAEPWPPVP